MYVGMWALRSFSERTVPGFSFQSGYAVVSTFPYMFFAEWLQELAVHSALNVIHTLANSCKKLPGEVVPVYSTKEFRLDKIITELDKGDLNC